MGSVTPLPYWQVNVPPEEREAECPDFLRDLNAKDIGIISTPDSQYATETWPAVRRKCAENRLDLFQRRPSDLRRYLAYNWGLKRRYGSVMDFVVKERLRWEQPIRPSGTRPFEREEDVKVLWNDWPYGIDERIVHLVVWTKFELAEDPATGDITEETRAQIQAYVDRVFGARMPKENYVWFKNWQSLKSIKSVEHFHVMLFDPDPAFVDEITHGDVPLSKKLAK
ncbi:N-acetylglucosamine-induced protein 1 [Pleurostoma richardsiae]|uniref:N-acetylglucosamine-induced protein 1 n=1 Tax=Pleurostoma richardsiae TaxID=41990 RepID=A0AA38VR22_9PEZI|nr:N-acetylglucosamine-induced protein 1 [Pleurostoma richardsiae]